MSASIRSSRTAAPTISSESGSVDGSTRATAASWARIRAADSRIRSRCVAHDSTTASITIRKLGIPCRGSGGK